MSKATYTQLSLTVASMWASTKPGQTKFHYYDADGQSLCSYERKPGTLVPWQDTRKLPPTPCSSCLLHYQKGDHLQAAAPAPVLILDPEARVRVLKGKLKGAIGRAGRYDAQAKMYFVVFTSGRGLVKKVQFEPILATEIEELPNE